MSFGKSSSTSTPTLTQEQKDAIKAQTDFLTGTIVPTYTEAVGGAKDVYQQNAGGYLNAAQNLAGTSRQAQDVLGSTGESALRTGITGLQSLFDPDYEMNQIRAALSPAQQQYSQNLAGQQMQFGGAGNLGSARQAIAGQQLAGSTMAAQQAAAANVQNQIASQRANAALSLANLGQGGLGQAQQAAGTVLGAAEAPSNLYNKYASVIFGTPSAAYTPNFAGTQGGTTTTTGGGIKFNPIQFPGM